MLDDITMEFIYGLLKEGHYVNIVTNATITKRIDEICNSLPLDQRNRIMFIASFHYLELKNKKLLKTYYDNLIKLRNSGVSYYTPMVLCNDYIKIADEIKSSCNEALGIIPQTVRVRDQKSSDLHILTDMEIDDYYDFGIKKFNSKSMQFERDWYQKKINEFCYAGDWYFYLDLCTGEMRACYLQPVFDKYRLGDLCK